LQGAVSSPWWAGSRSSVQNSWGSLWAWRRLGEAGQTNSGPSCPAWGGAAQRQSWPPPRTFGNCPVLGGRQGRKGSAEALGLSWSPEESSQGSHAGSYESGQKGQQERQREPSVLSRDKPVQCSWVPSPQNRGAAPSHHGHVLPFSHRKGPRL
jgi:hypothetical protein